MCLFQLQGKKKLFPLVADTSKLPLSNVYFVLNKTGLLLHQVIIAQWLVQRLATGEVPGSNPTKGDNLLISD